jgi:hypothetical protein
MDKATARTLSEALKAFLAPFEEENDVKVTVGSGKFDRSRMRSWTVNPDVIVTTSSASH